MNQIYTAGYSGHTPAQLQVAAEELGALVVDIRWSPRSRAPGWNGEELEALLGERYRWCRAFGNVNYANGGEIKMPHLSIGMRHLAQWVKEQPLILLCGCPDASSCHRREIARMLEAAGWTVPEFVWPVEVSASAIPCLSLWQPWASLIAIKAKLVETRGWATDYRGPLAIQAAKNTRELRICATEPFYSVLKTAGLVCLPDELRGASQEEIEDAADDMTARQLLELFPLPLGEIVAVADLKECTPTGPDLWERLTAQEREFGDYERGRFGWELANVRRLKKPIPQRGAQKLFPVSLPDNVMRFIKAAPDD